jgi:hypothetical protein
MKRDRVGTISGLTLTFVLGRYPIITRAAEPFAAHELAIEGVRALTDHHEKLTVSSSSKSTIDHSSSTSADRWRWSKREVSAHAGEHH